MYKAVVRMLIRRDVRALNEGRYHPALAMFAPDAELSFPGDNTWPATPEIDQNSETLALNQHQLPKSYGLERLLTKIGWPERNCETALVYTSIIGKVGLPPCGCS